MLAFPNAFCSGAHDRKIRRAHGATGLEQPTLTCTRSRNFHTRHLSSIRTTTALAGTAARWHRSWSSRPASVPSGHRSFRSSSSRSRAQESWFFPEPEKSGGSSHLTRMTLKEVGIKQASFDHCHDSHHETGDKPSTILSFNHFQVALTIQVVKNRRVFDEGHISKVLRHTSEMEKHVKVLENV